MSNEEPGNWGVSKRDRWVSEIPRTPNTLRPIDTQVYQMLSDFVESRGRYPYKIVSSAEHDQIWFDVEPAEIDALTDEQVLWLRIRTVFLCSELDSLSMFV